MEDNIIYFYRIIDKNGGTPPLTFMLFNLVANTIGDPPKPTEDVDFSSFTIPVSDDHDNRFAIPTLEKLGMYFLMCFMKSFNQFKSYIFL